MTTNVFQIVESKQNMGLKAAVQALKKAEPLKDKIQRCKDLLNDNDAWLCQQQLQKIYQRVLILDLEYALDRKVEQELWNLGFKNYIAMLQMQTKDRKNPKRGEFQAMLSWCLEAASGFYLTLLQEICTAFDLDLPFRRKGYVYGCISPWKSVEKLSVPHKSSCFYACQYCLVHLGDIARYRNQNKQAELFYRHAVSLSPSSGQPYNQLALLEASRGNKLGTVFHYARSIAVKHPFPAAVANLGKTLASILSDDTFGVEGITNNKLTAQEYIIVFLKLHATLHNLGDRNIAVTYVKLLTERLTALVATESFTSTRLVQMLVINLFAVHGTAEHVTANDANISCSTDTCNLDKRTARSCALDLIAGSLSALLLPVYTIKHSIVDYFALPTIKLCLDWISLQQTVLEETAFSSRLQIWPSLCVLLNGLQACVSDFNYECYMKIPLPEDRDLQGFLPLEKNFETLQFSNTDLEDNAILNKLRAVRILQLSRRIAKFQVDGSALIIIDNRTTNDEDRRFFASTVEGVGPSTELMKELEELSLNKDYQQSNLMLEQNSPVPSETASSKGSSELDITTDLSLERRTGILKPQGSLERNRDTIMTNAESSKAEVNFAPSNRKPRQNVAMQAIMRRAENEQKQVTFKNVSPSSVGEDKIAPNVGLPSTKLIVSNKVTVDVPKTNFDINLISSQNVCATNIAQQETLTPDIAITSCVVQNQSNLNNTNMCDNNSHYINSNGKSGNSIGNSNSNNTTIATCQSMYSRPGTTSTPPVQTNSFPLNEQQQHTAEAFSFLQNRYQNQSFSVQNPQFSNTFMTNHGSVISRRILEGQIAQTPAVQTIDSQQNTSLLHSQLQQQQNQIGNPLSSQVVHQNAVSGTLQSIGLQRTLAANGTLQQNIDLQKSVVGNIHHRGIMQNTLQNTTGMNISNPLNVASQNITNNTGIVGMSGLASFSAYQKNVQQQAGTVVNMPVVTGITSDVHNVHFGQSHLGQNICNPGNMQSVLSQKQLSVASVSFPNTSVGQFAAVFPPNRTNDGQQLENNYAIPYKNYESNEFNPWKEQPQQQAQPQTHVLQPSHTWWDNASTVHHSRLIQNKDMPANSPQSWLNVPTATNVGRVRVATGNEYHQNHLRGPLPYESRSNVEKTTTLFDVDEKHGVTSNASGNTYSLFSGGNTWVPDCEASTRVGGTDQMKTRINNQQSLWSGPGPSPLERLLEQQKSQREGGT